MLFTWSVHDLENATHHNTELASIYVDFSCHIVFFLTQIANYIPFDEDLDYPAKLQHTADVKTETASVSSLSLLLYPGLKIIDYVS